MAEVKTEETLVVTCSIPGKTSDSGEDPPISATKTGREKPEKNDAEAFRQTKRRKNCPSALEKFEVSANSACNSSFSFTFDTNSQATTLQFTPKFGSFKLVEPPAAEEAAACIQIPARENKEEESEL